MKKVFIKSNRQGKQTVSMRGTVTIRAYKAGTKELVQEIVQRNIIMQGSYTGMDQLVKRLIGDTTYTAVVNYGAIGTGSTTPSPSDTQLTTESARTTVAFSQDVGFSQAKIQFFFADSILSNTTYREFGMFIDGTASANTGKIFNHALFTSAYVKAGGTDTTVEVDIDFS